MNPDFEYEKNNVGYDIKCKNYIICNTMLPEWWYGCKGHYLCPSCDIMFGKY